MKNDPLNRYAISLPGAEQSKLHSSEKFRTFTITISTMVCFLGLLVAVGWIADSPVLKTVLPGYPSMKFNTAISFLLLGYSFSQTTYSRKKWNKVSGILVVLVLMCGIVSLSEDVFGVDLGVDQSFLADLDFLPENPRHPGRMSAISAVCFGCMSLAFFGIHSKWAGHRLLAQGLLHVVTLLGAVAIIGYVLNIPVFYKISFFTSMAFHTSIAFFVFSIAVSLVNPTLGVTALFTGSNIGSKVARKLFVQMTIAILILVCLLLLSIRSRTLTVEFGIALFSVSFILVSLYLIARTSHELSAVDLKKSVAESSLTKILTFLNSTPDPIVIVNESGTIQLSNIQTDTVFGYEKGELVGQQIEVLLPERFRAGHEGHRNSYFNAPKVRSMGTGMDLFALTKKGVEIPVEVSLSPIAMEDRTWVSAAIRDISQRKAAQHALEEFKYFFNHSQDLSCVANTQGFFEVINPNFEKTLGYTREELLTNSFLSFIHPDDVEPTLKEVEKLTSGAITINFVNRYRKKDGTYLWFDWNTAPDAPSGKLYAIARDITERKEEEERRRNYLILDAKSKEMEQFVYIASHDLREPLLTIKNYMDVLEEDYGDSIAEGAREYMHSISGAVNRMDTLVTDFLDYSRLSKVKVLFDVDCNAIIMEVKADLDSIITSRQAILHAEDLPRLRAYPLELKLLFQNLVGNAIKFSRKEVQPVIHITAEQIEHGWLFKVVDNGIGMDEKDLKKIFTIFQRLHTKNEFEGTGIGLAHCKKIAELHNGQIWAESVPGVSSSFYFTILTESI